MISFLGDVLSYLTDSANWQGRRGLPTLLWEHVSISVVGTIIAALLAIPFAVYLGHVRRGGFLAVSAVNIGRAIPSFGLVGIFFPITLSIPLLASPLGYWATMIALVLLAMPPMFVNAYTAVRETDPAVVEAGRGMGMSGWEVLRSVEVPLGLPLIMAGIRVATVAVIATATLGAVVGYGGFGRLIIDGFAQGDDVKIFVGGLFVALLAVGAEVGLGWVENRVDPMRRTGGPAPEQELVVPDASMAHPT